MAFTDLCGDIDILSNPELLINIDDFNKLIYLEGDKFYFETKDKRKFTMGDIVSIWYSVEVIMKSASFRDCRKTLHIGKCYCSENAKLLHFPTIYDGFGRKLSFIDIVTIYDVIDAIWSSESFETFKKKAEKILATDTDTDTTTDFCPSIALKSNADNNIIFVYGNDKVKSKYIFDIKNVIEMIPCIESFENLKKKLGESLKSIQSYDLFFGSIWKLIDESKDIQEFREKMGKLF
jgi:hypothetical protein